LVSCSHNVYMKQWFPHPLFFFSYIKLSLFAQYCIVAKLKHETFTGIRQGILKLCQPTKDKSVCLHFSFFCSYLLLGMEFFACCGTKDCWLKLILPYLTLSHGKQCKANQ
jgi:hypothetical protein